VSRGDGPFPAGEKKSRREFLKIAGRALLGGALGLLGASLLARAASGAGRSCVNNSYCRACARRADCGLPQALSYRDKFGG
jgi:anaerobic selenocysteine-containing dehydrogenase